MNKYRRKEIEKIIRQLEDIRAEIENLETEEQDYYDNIPENLQMSERAENSQDALYNLSEAQCQLDDVIESLNSILYG